MSASDSRQRRPLAVQLSPDERAEVEAKARAAGLSLSGYARAQLLGAVTPRTQKAAPLPERQDLARLLAGLGKAGGNLNQLARTANQGQNVAADVIAATLAQVQAAAEDIRRTLK